MTDNLNLAELRQLLADPDARGEYLEADDGPSRLEVEASGSLEDLLDLIDKMGLALADFVEAVPPNEDFTAEDGVKVYGLQVDEFDAGHAREAIDAYRRAKEGASQ